MQKRSNNTEKQITLKHAVKHKQTTLNKHRAKQQYNNGKETTIKKQQNTQQTVKCTTPSLPSADAGPYVSFLKPDGCPEVPPDFDH